MTSCLLLGAGFSAPFNVPTMVPLYTGFIAHARRSFPRLEPVLDDLLQDIPVNADLEALLSRLNLATSATVALPKRLRTEEVQSWVEDAILLRSYLLAYIIDRCERFSVELVEERCPDLWRGVSQRSITVFSTNYDRVVEYGCDVAGIPFSDGFATDDSSPVRVWNGSFGSTMQLVKLHGSVTWYVHDTGTTRSFLSLDRGYPLPHPEIRLSRNGDGLDSLMIVPTLEKDALQRPYLDLIMHFGQTISESKLLVTIGASLRDEHLLSVIEYHAPNLVVLVLGHNASQIARRVEISTSIKFASLNVSTDQLLTELTEPLMQLFDEVEINDSPDDVRARVDAFVDVAQHQLRRLSELSDNELSALNELTHQPQSMGPILGALDVLGGNGHQDVVQAILDLLQTAEEPDVRAKAASHLGTVQARSAIGHLRERVLEDQSDLVRLECLLALSSIDSVDSEKVISELRAHMYDDKLWSYLPSSPQLTDNVEVESNRSERSSATG